MKERLMQLLDMEQLTPSKFADIIGVQRSSISHIISGRNKPSFDFLQKTLKAFPGLNAAWLVMGEGTMYEQMGRPVSGNLFDSQAGPEVLSEEHISEVEGRTDDITPANAAVSAMPGEQSSEGLPDNQDEKQADSKEEEPIVPESTGKKGIVQLMVLYEDDTFKTFMPAQ